MTAPGRSRIAWLGFGVVALVGGTLMGWRGDFLDAVVEPPPLVRAALVGAFVLLALWLVGQAVRRLEAQRAQPPDALTGQDLAALVRGVRYVFLAVAAFAAAGGWLIGHPLPFIVALVIAGVDVLETTFLLAVVSIRGEP